ncbi:MAG: MBL fold metallo-hydrolase [Armatimonadota bacterium]
MIGAARSSAVAPGVVRLALPGGCNACLLESGDGRFHLVDTGMRVHFEAVRDAIARRYGPDARPVAILLTSARPDHAGCASALAAYYDVTVRIADAARPLLEGRVRWPEPDTAAAGILAPLAFAGPAGVVDPGARIAALEDLPEGWEAVDLPGPGPGHTGFHRAVDGVLIAGDALATRDTETAWNWLKGTRLALPPGAWILDWETLRRTWRRIAAMAPRALICGHGEPIVGDDLPDRLATFAETKVMVRTGSNISYPLRLGPDGRFPVPPPAPDPTGRGLTLAAGAFAVGTLIWWVRRGRGRA